MKRIAWWTVAVVLFASTAAAWAEKKPVDEKPRIDVVFVLDTTGSMGGLIQAAKEKIWAIANTLATAKPVPDIRLGFVAYRDRGDDCVTRLTPLTDDLDAAYVELMDFQAAGGGDAPESVNQALNEAVTRMPWRTDGRTYRVIFLVGDCPPHMDYPDDVKYPVTCEAAAKAGITVNTIQCGTDSATPETWRDIAHRAEGRYFRVEQSGSAIVASTPYDAELAELARKLDETRVYYGTAAARRQNGQRAEAAGEIYSHASLEAQAARAVFNGSKAGDRNFRGVQELVGDAADGRVKLAEVKEAELPEPMKAMSAEQRTEFVRAKQVEREKVRAQIRDLADKRQQHLEAEAKKAAGKATLDQGIFDCIREQAGRRGIEYEGGPAL